VILGGRMAVKEYGGRNVQLITFIIILIHAEFIDNQDQLNID